MYSAEADSLALEKRAEPRTPFSADTTKSDPAGREIFCFVKTPVSSRACKFYVHVNAVTADTFFALFILDSVDLCA